eukprot:1182759-Prorocentrum_minimum.AAC.4
MLSVTRVLVGIAQGAIFPSIHNELGKWKDVVGPQYFSTVVSLITSGMYLGSAVAMLVLPQNIPNECVDFVNLVYDRTLVRILVLVDGRVCFSDAEISHLVGLTRNVIMPQISAWGGPSMIFKVQGLIGTVWIICWNAANTGLQQTSGTSALIPRDLGIDALISIYESGRNTSTLLRAVVSITGVAPQGLGSSIFKPLDEPEWSKEFTSLSNSSHVDIPARVRVQNLGNDLEKGRTSAKDLPAEEARAPAVEPPAKPTAIPWGLEGWLDQPKRSERYSLAHLLLTPLPLPNTIAATNPLRALGALEPLTRQLSTDPPRSSSSSSSSSSSGCCRNFAMPTCRSAGRQGLNQPTSQGAHNTNGQHQANRHDLVTGQQDTQLCTGAAVADPRHLGDHHQQLLLPLHRVRADGLAPHLLREGPQDGDVARGFHEPAPLFRHVHLLQRQRDDCRPPHRQNGARPPAPDCSRDSSPGHAQDKSRSSPEQVQVQVQVLVQSRTGPGPVQNRSRSRSRSRSWSSPGQVQVQSRTGQVRSRTGQVLSRTGPGPVQNRSWSGLGSSPERVQKNRSRILVQAQSGTSEFRTRPDRSGTSPGPRSLAQTEERRTNPTGRSDGGLTR